MRNHRETAAKLRSQTVRLDELIDEAQQLREDVTTQLRRVRRQDGPLETTYTGPEGRRVKDAPAA